MAPTDHRPRKLRMSFKTALTPIFWLAAVNAVFCWAVSWLFWDRYEFSATLFGLGCFGIVAAVCAYLYLLVAKVDRPD
jgi:hypothetical protein